MTLSDLEMQDRWIHFHADLSTYARTDLEQLNST